MAWRSRYSRRVIAAAIVAALCAAASTAGEPADRGAIAEWRPDVRAARAYIESRAGEVGFALIDSRGRAYKQHAGSSAPAASLLKVMLMVAYLRQGEVRDRELTEHERRLIVPMIRRSANEPASRIFTALGRGPIENLADDVGMKHFRYTAPVWGACRTSASDQARLMRRLDRHLPERHEDFARRQLNSIVEPQRWGIAKAKPRGWRLYFKGGWGDRSGIVNHQVALLERRGLRISLAILTEHNPSHDYGSETLEGVARRLLRGLPR